MKLLTVSDKKLMIEGENLVELADMYDSSVQDFLKLFRLYLIANKNKLKSAVYLIDTSTTELISPNDDFQFKTRGELLTTAEGYEDMKKRVFDFAYTMCSNTANESYTHLETNYNDWKICKILTDEEQEYYSCLYSSSKPGMWCQKISNIRISKKHQAYKYAFIKR